MKRSLRQGERENKVVTRWLILPDKKISKRRLQEYLTLKNPGALNACFFHGDPRIRFQFYLMHASSHYCPPHFPHLNTKCLPSMTAWLCLHGGSGTSFSTIFSMFYFGRGAMWSGVTLGGELHVPSVRCRSTRDITADRPEPILCQLCKSAFHIKSKGPYPGQCELTVIFLQIWTIL